VSGGPPKDLRVGETMARIITRGRIPWATVDFPRYDENNEPVAKVYLRPLTQAEQDEARANAALYLQQAFDKRRTDARWKPEELEDNAVIAEILAIACREVSDPEKPFFPYGVAETRQCTTDELAMLFQSYNAVREKAYPTLRDMTEAEMYAWVRVLEEDAEQFPFTRISRSKLEAFCVWAAKSLVSLAQQHDGMTSTSSPALPS
jgi:hypothetical protein